MTQGDLFGLAALGADRLSLRQSLVARNIANVNTPGYVARDMKIGSGDAAAFDLQMKRTSPLHLVAEGQDGGAARARDAETWGSVVSGNSVSVEQELAKANQINRSFALNAGVVRAFHKLISATAKA